MAHASAGGQPEPGDPCVGTLQMHEHASAAEAELLMTSSCAEGAPCNAGGEAGIHCSPAVGSSAEQVGTGSQH